MKLKVGDRVVHMGDQRRGIAAQGIITGQASRRKFFIRWDYSINEVFTHEEIYLKKVEDPNEIMKEIL